MIGLGSEDEIILQGISLVITEPQRVILSQGEVELAVQLQQLKIDRLIVAKDRETVYELVSWSSAYLYWQNGKQPSACIHLLTTLTTPPNQ